METSTQQPDLSMYPPHVQAICKALGWSKPPEVSPERAAELDAAMAEAREYAAKFWAEKKRAEREKT
ncbi:hypothetical protein Val02_81080 [Virgisporangium aliadipatigenens]|uniref:Uncharacterized protein n=1 Tax=Virgisporangium aliadipatigenens TaxID=741659 RepID=A0A8J4DWL2_9ACTN|nr:hypothetical protein [Virgisporangium aliadipatigenens]GIJ51222.1 hypothetical protein Val02_81080 [Virgisporangium aliadipatigenens]